LENAEKAMPLHRDIFWVGRQWAVTGSGMQAIDQRLKGKYDIEVSRLWDDGLPESLRADGWLNIEDFRKGLAVARKRHPEPAGKISPPERTVSPLKDVSPLGDGGAATQPKPAAPTYEMRIEGSIAKFVSPWRVRRQR
jgi:hypothetical protein